jgi:LmbE family N-acetylglucosaminyl deacetylase
LTDAFTSLSKEEKEVTTFNRILVLAPHTDDGELGAGASINKWVHEGKEIHYFAFSAAEESVPSSFPKDELRKEVLASTATLGIPKENVQVFKYPVRKFSEYRQDILEELIKAKKHLMPELILIPSRNDIHQDHQVISMEGIRAFKHNRILGYELPWNNLMFHNICYSVINGGHLDKKHESLQCYKTQTYRTYFNREFIYGLAKVRGTQINADYAECFELVRWIL